ncbi:MAG: hypothetical protein AB7U97_20310 [Pirellulales bacterium]
MRIQLRLRRLLRGFLRLRQLRMQEDRLLYRNRRRLWPDVLGALRRRILRLQR